ncbi:MAG TPA: hypothetical protein VMT52_19290 [Planctomycetota bacterium]|nr:hypothetical protein [Planctomycetota bacterium]
MTGFVGDSSPESITLIGSRGEETVVPREKVSHLEPLEISIMPSTDREPSGL